MIDRFHFNIKNAFKSIPNIYLRNAIYDNNIERLQELHESGVDIERYTSQAYICALYQQQSNNEELVKYLLEIGLGGKGMAGYDSSLYVDAFCGNIDAVKEWFNTNGSRAITQNIFGFNPLHYGIYGSHFQVVESLLQKRADLIPDSQKTFSIAAYVGDIEIFELLSKHITISDRIDHREVLKHAVYGGSVNMLNHLLENESFAEVFRNMPEILHIAVLSEEIEMVQKICQSANNNIATLFIRNHDYDGHIILSSVLDTAATIGNLEIFEYLNKVKQNSNITIETIRNAITPMHWAALGGSTQIMERVLSENFQSLNRGDNHGMMPIHYAVESGNTEAVEWLKNHSASLIAITNDRRNIMHIAAKNADVNMIKKIHELQDGLASDFNKDNDTPLFCMLREGLRINTNMIHDAYKECVQVLLFMNPQQPLHFHALMNNVQMINALEPVIRSILEIGLSMKHHNIFEHQILYEHIFSDAKQKADKMVSDNRTANANLIAQKKQSTYPIDFNSMFSGLVKQACGITTNPLYINDISSRIGGNIYSILSSVDDNRWQRVEAMVDKHLTNIPKNYCDLYETEQLNVLKAFVLYKMGNSDGANTIINSIKHFLVKREPSYMYVKACLSDSQHAIEWLEKIATYPNGGVYLEPRVLLAEVCRQNGVIEKVQQQLSAIKTIMDGLLKGGLAISQEIQDTCNELQQYVEKYIQYKEENTKLDAEDVKLSDNDDIKTIEGIMSAVNIRKEELTQLRSTNISNLTEEEQFIRDMRIAQLEREIEYLYKLLHELQDRIEQQDKQIEQQAQHIEQQDKQIELLTLKAAGVWDDVKKLRVVEEKLKAIDEEVLTKVGIDTKQINLLIIEISNIAHEKVKLEEDETTTISTNNQLVECNTKLERYKSIVQKLSTLCDDVNANLADIKHILDVIQKINSIDTQINDFKHSIEDTIEEKSESKNDDTDVDDKDGQKGSEDTNITSTKDVKPIVDIAKLKAELKNHLEEEFALRLNEQRELLIEQIASYNTKTTEEIEAIKDREKDKADEVEQIKLHLSQIDNKVNELVVELDGILFHAKAIETMAIAQEAKDDQETQLKALLSDDYNAAFYRTLQDTLNATYLASSVVCTEIVANNRVGTTGTIGKLLQNVSNYTPMFGAGLQILGSVLQHVDSINQRKMISNYANLVSLDQITALSKQIAIKLLNDKSLTIKESNNWTTTLKNFVTATISTAATGISDISGGDYDNIVELIETAVTDTAINTTIDINDANSYSSRLKKWSINKIKPGVVNNINNNTNSETMRGEHDAEIVSQFIISNIFAGKIHNNNDIEKIVEKILWLSALEYDTSNSIVSIANKVFDTLEQHIYQTNSTLKISDRKHKLFVDTLANILKNYPDYLQKYKGSETDIVDHITNLCEDKGILFSQKHGFSCFAVTKVHLVHDLDIHLIGIIDDHNSTL